MTWMCYLLSGYTVYLPIYRFMLIFLNNNSLYQYILHVECHITLSVGWTILCKFSVFKIIPKLRWTFWCTNIICNLCVTVQRWTNGHHVHCFFTSFFYKFFYSGQTKVWTVYSHSFDILRCLTLGGKYRNW